MDLRQSSFWADYLSSIGWKVEKFGSNHALVKTIPVLNRSLIKVQRPQNPIPFHKIDQIALKHKALFVLIEPENEKYSEAELIKHHYSPSYMTLTHTATIQLDLTQSEQKLWSNLSQNAKRNIKKAQTNNLQVKYFPLAKKDSGELFAQFNDLQQSLTKIRKFWQPGTQEMGKKMQAFKDSSALFLAYLPNSSQPIAGIWVGLVNKTAFYMHVGATPQGYTNLANYLLVWEAIKRVKQLGYKIWDFEGVYDPRFPKDRKKWRGFSEFKSRFHGELVEYPTPWIKFYNLPFKYFYLCSRFFN